MPIELKHGINPALVGAASYGVGVQQGRKKNLQRYEDRYDRYQLQERDHANRLEYQQHQFDFNERRDQYDRDFTADQNQQDRTFTRKQGRRDRRHDRDMFAQSGLADGSLELSPDGLEAIQKIDNTEDENERSGKYDEEQLEELRRKNDRQRQIVQRRHAQPKQAQSLEDQFNANTYERDGKLYSMVDGKPTLLDDSGAQAKTEAESRRKEIATATATYNKEMRAWEKDIHSLMKEYLTSETLDLNEVEAGIKARQFLDSEKPTKADILMESEPQVAGNEVVSEVPSVGAPEQEPLTDISSDQAQQAIHGALSTLMKLIGAGAGTGAAPQQAAPQPGQATEQLPTYGDWYSVKDSISSGELRPGGIFLLGDGERYKIAYKAEIANFAEYDEALTSGKLQSGDIFVAGDDWDGKSAGNVMQTEQWPPLEQPAPQAEAQQAPSQASPQQASSQASGAQPFANIDTEGMSAVEMQAFQVMQQYYGQEVPEEKRGMVKWAATILRNREAKQ